MCSSHSGAELSWVFHHQPSLVFFLFFQQKLSRVRRCIWVVVSNMFYFHPYWGNDPIWLIFFKGVETTNQCMNWTYWSLCFFLAKWWDSFCHLTKQLFLGSKIKWPTTKNIGTWPAKNTKTRNLYIIPSAPNALLGSVFRYPFNPQPKTTTAEGSHWSIREWHGWTPKSAMTEFPSCAVSQVPNPFCSNWSGQVPGTKAPSLIGYDWELLFHGIFRWNENSDMLGCLE